MVSVIMPTYNDAHYIGQAIESVMAQSYRDWELIVVIDGSTDNTEEIVKEYADRDSRVRYIADTNHGVAYARNTGISAARGEFIAFLDSDDYYSSEFLNKMVDFASQFSKDDFFYTSFFRVYENGDIKPAEIRKVEGKWDSFIEKGYDLRLVFDIRSVFIKKRLLDKYNIHFDEGIIMSEDTGFFMKILTVASSRCLEDHLAYYRIRANSATTRPWDPDRWQGTVINHRFVLPYVEKYYPEKLDLFKAMWGYRAYRFVLRGLRSEYLTQMCQYIEDWRDVMEIYNRQSIRFSDRIKLYFMLKNTSWSLRLASKL